MTVYRARTAPRAIFAEATVRAATRTGARTAVAEETVKADMISAASRCVRPRAGVGGEGPRARPGRRWVGYGGVWVAFRFNGRCSTYRVSYHCGYICVCERIGHSDKCVVEIRPIGSTVPRVVSTTGGRHTRRPRAARRRAVGRDVGRRRTEDLDDDDDDDEYGVRDDDDDDERDDDARECVDARARATFVGDAEDDDRATVDRG